MGLEVEHAYMPKDLCPNNFQAGAVHARFIVEPQLPVLYMVALLGPWLHSRMKENEKENEKCSIVEGEREVQHQAKGTHVGM